MRKKRFTFEFDGTFDPDYLWRDSLYYLLSLQVKDVLNFHHGCVNTIVWDETGECLLSGSDDRRIAITRLFASLSNQQNEVVFSQKLPADSNIFSAKFLPYTSNSQIVVGFKCGCVLFVRPEAPPESRIQVVYCHGYAVYDVLPMPDLPHCFLTLSHDQSVMCFDTRIPFGYRSSHQSCNQRCAYPGYQPMSSQPAGLYRLRFQFPVTAGDIHPLDGSRLVALGSADGFVRLFDLRKITTSYFSSSEQGTLVDPVPFKLTRPLGLPAQLAEQRSIRLDYGPAHITSIQFEPLYSGSNGRAFSAAQYGRLGSHPAGMGGRRLLVSHMYAPVFLFDLNQEELPDESTPQNVDWLPNWRGDESGGSPSVLSGSGTTIDQTINNRTSDPEARLALVFFRWLERQRAQRQTEAMTDTEGSTALPEEEVTEPPGTRSTSSNSTANRPGQAAEEESSTLSPFELLTEEYVSKVLASAPRARQIMGYRGRRSCRTVIKTAVFWGRDFILSGSECGHVIVWNRWSGEPVSVFVGDSTVVNRISPHPRLPLIACSGIDRSVKIVEPDPSIFETSMEKDETFTDIIKEHAIKASTICDINTNHMRASLRSGSFILERLARIRTGQAIRSILRRLGVVNRISENRNSGQIDNEAENDNNNDDDDDETDDEEDNGDNNHDDDNGNGDNLDNAD